MVMPSKPLQPAPGSGGASVEGHAGMEHPNLAVGLGNPGAGVIMTNEVDSCECSETRKGQPIPPDYEIVSIDHHTSVMTCAAGVTFDCHEHSSAFCLMDAHNTCYAKQVNENEKHTVAAAGFEASADVDITKTKLADGYWLDSDVSVSGATKRQLQALNKDQMAEGKGALMMIGKVARVKQPVASLEVSSDSGISAYSKHGTKSMSPLLRVCQVWLFLLVILLSISQVHSSVEAKRQSAEIGSCRFDLTSVATLLCVQPDGNRRPPSKSCCSALLYAIDRLPVSNESGACCLCRYISQRYPYFALATSYVLCKGKDRSIIITWSSVPLHCYMVCRRRNASSHGVGTPAVVLGTRSKDFKIPWIAALVVAVICAILLACFCYHWWYKPVPNPGESQPLSLQRRGSFSEIRDERESSAQRRMSSRGSPDG